MGGGCVFLVGGASFTVRILSVLIAKDMANLRVRVQVTGLSWAGWRRDTYPVPTRLQEIFCLPACPLPLRGAVFPGGPLAEPQP